MAMRKIVVQAFEDPSRPQGGHAVILLRGVDSMPERPSIRLRPVEVGDSLDARGLWRGARITPLATRSTPLGIELVVGPDVVGHPQLLAGTPVVIEVPEADVRGEFLWPGVAPLAAPRRRHVVVPRHPRQIIATPEPANDDAQNLVTAADHLPPAAEANGNLALAAEHANGALAVPSARPAAAPQPADATATPPTAAADEAGLPHSAREVAELREALAAALAASSGAAASHAAASPAGPPHAAPPPTSAAQTGLPAGLGDGLPSRSAAEPKWTPGGREGFLAGNGLLVAVAAVALFLGGAFWSMQGRRAAPSDVVAAGAGAAPGPARATGGNTTGSGNGPSGAGASAAAVGPAAVAGKPAVCAAPAITTEPMSAGRMRLAIKAACKGGETVHIIYGGADSVVRLDDAGALSTVVDCFAGAAEPLEVRFADASKQTVAVTAADLDRVSKVAVVWKAPVDLDLHAFEYAALPGAKGDVWAGAAGSADAVRQAVAAEHRGHGFISSSADARGSGDHIEVYTFVHADEQTSGSVGLALDHATRGAVPSDATCGKGALAEVPYSLVVLARNAPPRRESGIIAAAECGSRLGPEVRFNQSALPVLKLRK